MKTFDFCIVTPSYAPDFERCRLLCKSIEQFVTPPVDHYVIVERRDLRLFRQLQGSRTEILPVQSILPWWIRRLPGARRWWLSMKTPPIRNWICQQLIKIAAA
jgi:hypothetical protein